MMVIRPVERSDVSALMQLASKTGGGLTSFPPMKPRFRRVSKGQSKPGKANCPKVSRAMCSCWKIARQAQWRGFAPLRWQLG